MPHRLYYVSCPEDNTVLVAMDTRISAARTAEGQTIYTIQWFDTIKERVMQSVEIVKDEPNEFAFKRSDGQQNEIYTFVPMTLDVYNKRVRQHLLQPENVSSEDDLIRRFEETKKRAW